MAYGQLLKFKPTRDYIFQADFEGVTSKIAEKYKIPLERADELMQMVYGYLDQVITLEHMPDLVQQAFGIDSKNAKALSIELVGNILLPLTNYLPGLEQEFIKLGGKLADYPVERMPRDRNDDLVILRQLIAGTGIELSDVIGKRLLFLLQQFARGEKTEEVLRTYCVRSINIGGLGLTEEQTTALLAAVVGQVGELVASSADLPQTNPPVPPQTPSNQTSPLSKGEKYSEPVVKQELEIAPSHELTAEVPVVNAPMSDLPLTPLLAKEGKYSESELNELKGSAKRAVAVRKLTATTQDSLASALALATKVATPVLKKNKISEKVFADVTEKALKGIRDIYQTRDIVERDWKLKGEDLVGVMDAISQGIENYQQSSQEAPRRRSGSVIVDDVDGGKTPDDELDDRFAKLTDKTDGQIKPVTAQLTVGSTVPVTSTGQRRMVDVVSSTRLVGPIEQLGKMTPTEFRRLSSNAAEAGQKVEDLLSALEATSYDERVKGVLAWRESPMNQLYLQIAEEALSQGLALSEVSSRRRAAGKDSLSPAEIKALALLNAKIRF